MEIVAQIMSRQPGYDNFGHTKTCYFIVSLSRGLLSKSVAEFFLFQPVTLGMVIEARWVDGTYYPATVMQISAKGKC